MNQPAKTVELPNGNDVQFWRAAYQQAKRLNMTIEELLKRSARQAGFEIVNIVCEDLGGRRYAVVQAIHGVTIGQQPSLTLEDLRSASSSDGSCAR